MITLDRRRLIQYVTNCLKKILSKGYFDNKHLSGYSSVLNINQDDIEDAKKNQISHAMIIVGYRDIGTDGGAA